MSFFNLFKKTPKWRHADPLVRRRAVAELPDGEHSLLLRLAGEDPDCEVRRLALDRIGDWRLLTPLAAGLGEVEAAREVNRRLDQLRLAEILAAQGSAAKQELMAGLTRESLLAEIVLQETDLGARRLAVEMIESQEALAGLAIQNCGKAIGLLIVDRISDGPLLVRLAREAAGRAVRARAQQRASVLAEKDGSAPETLRQRELARVAGRVAALEGEEDEAAALKECRQLQRALRELAPPDPELWSRLDRLCQAFSQREQESAAREQGRLSAERHQGELRAQGERIVSGLEALLALAADDDHAEATLAALKASWVELEAQAEAADWLVLLRASRDRAEADFFRSRERLAAERLEESGLLAALAEVSARFAAQELETANRLLAETQARFDDWHPKLIGRQQVAAGVIDVRERRQEALIRQDEYRRAREEADLARRREWLDELRGLLATDDPRQGEAGLQEITARWRQPGAWPEAGVALEGEFAALSGQVAERLAALRREEGWRRWHNKTVKLELIKEAESLDRLEDPAQVFKRIKALQESWRLIGPAPAKEENGLWLGFKEATERNFVRCREFFQGRDQEIEQRLAARAELVNLAVSRQDSEEWRETAAFMRDLQAQWKAIGPVPRDREQELFGAFRAACDHFFVRRQGHLAVLEAGREANRMQKEALCQEAEGWAAQPDLSHKAKFKDLQSRWKACGPAPKGEDEPLWQRLRAACDRYYAWLDTLRPENLARKEGLCQEAQRLTAELGPEVDFVKLGQRMVELQRQWREIGPAPEGEQEAPWQRFKGSCDLFFVARAARETAIDQARPGNQARREALLARVKELAAAKVSRETVREIIACQGEWQGLGPGDKGRDREMRQEFSALCGAFFKERREAAQEIDRLNRENLRLKEALCLRLEIMAGTDGHHSASVSSGERRSGGLTLAEQLHLAFETNFVLAADDAADKARRAQDEIKLVRREWQRLGPVPPEHEHLIRRRYTEALAAALKGQA